jgi:hypothetical protein
MYKQAVEKRLSAALPSSFVVAAYIQVRLTPQDFERLASACLREAASAKAGAFLISLKRTIFSTGSEVSTPSTWGISFLFYQIDLECKSLSS